MSMTSYDVIVVGGGNAGFSAAHAARERGARVLLLEKGTAGEAGGNSYYTAGAFRFPCSGLDELRPLIEEDPRHATTDVPPYTAEDFLADMKRVTDGRCDPVLTGLLVGDAAGAVGWLAGKGIRWRLMYERQAYESDGRWRFFGGLVVGTVGGGKGLIAGHTGAAVASGVEIRYGAAVTSLLRDGQRVTGVEYRDASGAAHEVTAPAVVLAAGGFEADPERRARHLGPEWRRAKIRGNP
ncbi:FAD-dependent oxidoreductase [Nonomuraea thailandensis]